MGISTPLTPVEQASTPELQFLGGPDLESWGSPW